MNDEQEQLARGLRTLAHHEPATPPSVELLVRRGRRARRARVATMTGVAGAGLALAVAAQIMIPSADPAGPPRLEQASPASRPLDARSILLAAAETAAREPATSGRYWYARERVVEPWTLRKKEPQPFSATVSVTIESWFAAVKGARGAISVKDAKVTFATPADKEKWREMGSPRLWPGGRSTNHYAIELFFPIGTHRFSTKELGALPADKDELEGRLRQLYDEEPAPSRGRAKPAFADFVWWTARYLLAGPITPATRAALYQVLAEQPGIISRGEVTDSLGRTGNALVLSHGTEYQLVVDEDTARLLAFDYRPEGRPAATIRVAYQEQRWVDRLFDR